MAARVRNVKRKGRRKGELFDPETASFTVDTWANVVEVDEFVCWTVTRASMACHFKHAGSIV
jgi:hypothetical protein